MFPSFYRDVDFTKLRDANTISREFEKLARKTFPRIRFHDLRGSHETALLDAGVPVHVVAARCGHDPAVLLRSSAKRTRKADASAANAIGSLSKPLLDSGGENISETIGPKRDDLGPRLGPSSTFVLVPHQ